jgi:hypothetical protein
MFKTGANLGCRKKEGNPGLYELSKAVDDLLPAISRSFH